MVFFNCPGAFKKFFTSKVVACKTFFFELTFYYVLSCNTCVVCTSEPQSIITFHAVIANYDIL